MQKTLNSVANDVIGVIVGRGGLTKSEIMEMWDLDEEKYGSLKEKLNKESSLELGAKGVGGFRIHQKKRERLPDEGLSRGQVFDSEWENTAVSRLVELLTHKELEDLLGPLVYTVRRARFQLTGEDRRGTKSELASALIIQNGCDLFCKKEIRQLIAKKRQASFPRRWSPGKDAAIRFVQETGFPLEYAGTPSEEVRPDFEFLEGRIDLPPLQPFQKEVAIKMLETMRSAGGRAIVTLPTGAGKTRVAVDSIRDWLTEHWNENTSGVGNTIIWLAHTEELCEQAYNCFRDVWQASSSVAPLWLFRFWGGYTQDLVKHRETLENLKLRPAVVISTPQRVANLLAGKISGAQEILQIIRETTGLLVIDEAHRAAAPTYKTILEHTTTDTELTVLGLTATPFRGEYANRDPEAGARKLKELFDGIIEPIETLGDNPRVELQKHGFLAEPVEETIKTKTVMNLPGKVDLKHITSEEIEKIDRALKARADNPDRRMLILQHILPICQKEDTQMLYFGPSVLDAECMAFLLREKGIPAAFVCGETRDVTRRRIIGDFKKGRIKVLCNCEVLTTGFDAPKVSHVVMARPTVSQVLYEQMLGRGLRGPRFGGTEKCMVIDCEDNYREDRPMLGYQAFRTVWGAQ